MSADSWMCIQLCRVRKIALRGAITRHGVWAILRTLSAYQIGSLPEATLDLGQPPQSADSTAFFT